MKNKLFRYRKGHSGNVHMLIGLAVIGVIYLINQNYQFIQLKLTTLDIVSIIIITMFFSRLPDQDIEGSKINDIVVIALIGIILWAITSGNTIYGIIPAVYIAFLQVVNHRGIVHSFVMALIMSAPLYFIKPLYFWVGLIAYIGHLVSEGEFNIWQEKDWKLFK